MCASGKTGLLSDFTQLFFIKIPDDDVKLFIRQMYAVITINRSPICTNVLLSFTMKSTILM